MKTNKLIKGIIFTFSLLLPLSFYTQAQANNSKGQIRTLTIEQAEALKHHKSSAKRSTAKRVQLKRNLQSHVKLLRLTKRQHIAVLKRAEKIILKHKLKLV